MDCLVLCPTYVKTCSYTNGVSPRVNSRKTVQLSFQTEMAFINVLTVHRLFSSLSHVCKNLFIHEWGLSTCKQQKDCSFEGGGNDTQYPSSIVWESRSPLLFLATVPNRPYFQSPGGWVPWAQKQSLHFPW